MNKSGKCPRVQNYDVGDRGYAPTSPGGPMAEKPKVGGPEPGWTASAGPGAWRMARERVRIGSGRAADHDYRILSPPLSSSASDRKLME